ncbi:Triacylglycerol lipase [Bertholletia excelsa]
MGKWILVASLLAAVALLSAEANHSPLVFIFGDSTTDVGTNNYLKKSLARADMPYYGIDYPGSKATGRFSNGYNTADLTVRALLKNGEKSPPPFLRLIRHPDTLKHNLLWCGANFASAGSGILDATGNVTWKKVVPLSEQISQFATARSNITAALKNKSKADALIAKSLFVISVGSNDFFDHQGAGDTTPPDTFVATLSQAYTNHLENLYNLGARKFGIISVPPIGCCPHERFLNGSGDCFDSMNDFAKAFYVSTASLLLDFSVKYPDVKYSLADAYNMTMVVIADPSTYGFKEVKKACCGIGDFNGEGPCNKTANLCQNRGDYLFYDWFHPTQNASTIAASILCDGPPQFVSPINFRQLALA